MTAAIACQIDVLQNAAGMLIDAADTEAAQATVPGNVIFSVKQSVELVSK